MGYICAIICCEIAFLGFYKDRRLFSASGCFAALWAVLILFSEFRLFDLYESSDFSYFIITLGVFFFSVGSAFMRKIKVSAKRSSNTINQGAYNWLVLICLIGLIYNFQVILTYITSGFDIKKIYLTMAQTVGGEETALSSLKNTTLERLQQYIGYPLLYTLVPVSIAAFFRERRIKYLVVAIGLSLVRFVYDFRRTYLVIIAAYIVILALLEIKRINMPHWMTTKFKRRLFTGIVFFLIAYFLISSQRRSDNEEKYSFIKNLYFYYVGSITYLSQRLEMIHPFEYTFGMTSLRGFFAPIVAIFGLLGFSEPKIMTIALENIESLHNVVLNITPTHRFNTYATLFLQFYFDGGIIGVIILSFLLGSSACYLYRRAVRYKSVRDNFRYAYFFSIFVILSVLHFNGVVVCYIWPFVIEYFLFSTRDYNPNME